MLPSTGVLRLGDSELGKRFPVGEGRENGRVNPEVTLNRSSTKTTKRYDQVGIG